MDERINLGAIERYSKSYSGKILDSFFSTHRHISGSEIKELCDIEQVNYFVLRELFGEWKTQLEKLRSPYFDYETTEVKGALDNFLTLLSNHIAVDREHFGPLLERAVSRTVLIILSPYDFFGTIVEGRGNVLNVARLGEDLKYIRINRAPLERLMEKLQGKGIQSIPGTEAFAMLDQILEEVSFTPDDVEPYVASFKACEPFQIESFYEQAKPPRKAQTQATINDKLATDKKQTLAEDFQKIPKIKDRLTINQKFMFTKVLFNGDFESFNKAVEAIDRLNNLQSAMHFLEAHSSKWDRESDEFSEFMEVIEKRFS